MRHINTPTDALIFMYSLQNKKKNSPDKRSFNNDFKMKNLNYIRLAIII